MLEKVKKLIRTKEHGSISYSEFMSTVLYDHELGYYMIDKQKIGKAGDFYTSSNVHSVFGKVLARIFVQLVNKGMVPPIICEIGAGTGRLANFILEEWQNIDQESFHQLRYYIVETSPYHRNEQQQVISNIEKVSSFQSIAEMTNSVGKLTGIVLSNELFDAFPVDVVEKNEGAIFEVRITLDDKGNLVETMLPCEHSQLIDWLVENRIDLKEGQRLEIPLAMANWLEETVDWLEKGILFTIDYGYTTEEWMDPVHREGSLRGYYKHEMIRNPLLYPGEMDLTTHIHLDALIQKGEEVDLRLLEMVKQTHFLLRGGILDYLQDHYDPNPFSEVSKQNRAIRTLLADDGISSSFTVVIQEKGIENITIKDVLVHDFF